ncbi:SseB family protein [Gymnodinialimonas sp. 2305UL16-5]|uniref:SseB family protein n=1 Tax=Gymnodinialimonas mytili TaxID=3126503 RepID=UPI00309964F3
MTPLDQAHAAMQAAPDDTQARLAWFDRLSASELFLMLTAEATEDSVTPEIFAVDGAQLVLAFDREDRLAEFAGGSVPYVALSGRAMAQMLAGADLGLAVNLGTGAEMVLEHEAILWLAQTLAERPEEIDAHPDELLPPKGLPDTLLMTLDTRLAAAEGRARLAYLVATRTDGAGQSHLLAFVDPVPGADGALAQLVREALAFSGLDAATLDVGFFRSADPICAKLAKVGLRFDLPVPAMPEPPKAPGSDPNTPPRLR